MYVVTGGAGFIGSAFVWKLNTLGIDEVLVVDTLGTGEKWKNLRGLRFADVLRKDEYLRLVREDQDPFATTAIIHMGACSSTTECDAEYLLENNFRYSQALARYAAARDIRLINASSAATYGDGAQGFDDNETEALRLRPLNMYGYSKQLFDTWALRHGLLPRLASLKFFNVYGPNEYHKGDMMSVACKAHRQIKQTGRLKLFKSHREGIAHGGQRRDFIYIKDCLDVMWWLLEHREVGGIFNVGTGEAESFAELGRAVFAAMGREPAIDYVDMPEHLRAKYQYYTCAPMAKLRAAGYEQPFTPIAQGVADYIQQYLEAESPYLESAGV